MAQIAQGERMNSYMEEYKHCSCSFIANKKKDLPAFCPRHQNPRKYIVKIPRVEEKELGYAGIG
jgi:hypothetical protein